MRSLSQAARQRLTEPWEECVLYVYDDKVPKRRIDGRLAYPEWDGGQVKGTLTIGFGHTDAAGLPKITGGLRMTRAEADQILSQDLGACQRAVNRLLKAPVTQHQFDALVDTWLNCPAASIAAIKLINAGRPEAVPAKLLQYTNSRGEHMAGLVHRRTAEIAWFNTSDGVEAPPAPNPEIVFSPKAERNPPPKTMAKSRTGIAAGTVAIGTVAEVAKSANDAPQPIKDLKGSLGELGLFDHLDLLAHNPAALIGAVVIALCVFIYFDRRSKLVNDHV
jgi:GH24 family phage-related lysozyme (muramidase)